MVIIFDLDDTLYPDESFVLSGFAQVAQALSAIVREPSEKIYRELVHELTIDRNEVFNRFLLKRGICTKKLVSFCLRIYRSHVPKIELFPEAEACLQRLKNFPLYVVTDGNKLVQKNKCKALGLFTKCKKCLFTNSYGKKHAKPSPYCFLKICAWEKVHPSEVMYVGDNPRKDFVGIKSLGFQTVRVLTGPYKGEKPIKKYDAEVTINSLAELLN